HQRKKVSRLSRQLPHQRRDRALELSALRRIFCQLPRRLAIDVLVAARNGLPERLERVVEQKAFWPDRRVVRLEVLCIRFVDLVTSPSRYYAIAVALYHRDRTTGEIAEGVGEIRVVALLESLPRKVAVAVERHFAHQEIAERIRAVATNRIPQIEIATSRFADTGTAHQNETVYPYALWRREPRRHEHRRPD